MKFHKHYYVAHSYMGLQFSYDSDCWQVLAFNSPEERAMYLKEYEYKDGQYVAKAVDASTAYKIAPDLRHMQPGKAWRTVHL